MPEYSFDLVVIGSGIAGQAAASSAAEAGLSVVMLEKTGSLGGSTAMSGGFFAFSGTGEQAADGVHDSADLFLNDMVAAGGGVSDRALLQTYLDHQAETYHWLKDQGVVFRALEISSGQSAPRSHNSVITEVLTTLHRNFTSHGGETRLNHRATRLVRENGKVTAVVVQSPDGESMFHSRGGIVLATGGFSRSTHLLRTFAPDALTAIPYGGKGNTGDGLKMAWKLGAGMADMSYVTATYGSHPDTGEEFHELLTAYYMGAIVVNKEGKRFMDESQSYKVLGREVLKEAEGLGFQIFDAKIRAKSHPGIPLNDIGMLENIGHVHKADSLEELARLAGIDAAGLVQTVARYNASITGDQADETGRTNLCNGVGELLPLDQAPFYAYPAKALMTTTYCGVTINSDAQVVDIDGDVIDGLYAIGEVTGGFHGAAYMTGTSLGKGAVFGRIVAQHASANLSPVRA
ncbi:FAD-dependent oxidoreductase [Pseudarthrobacter sulfonivorans]|uniref:FAD-dependent oxidoreductase n=1 Tax=Pseudarthrobacter sulfonivorans TaxID=121292 RepID=UPI002863506D|nr:FAD-dependent oxidoreductase [Pseudarthrobacter sulfonivorans]MDR6415338.1 fumarate reductase flavoprotein subunit [Pseudarthrobacter sulfonivorans]